MIPWLFKHIAHIIIQTKSCFGLTSIADYYISSSSFCSKHMNMTPNLCDRSSHLNTLYALLRERIKPQSNIFKPYLPSDYVSFSLELVYGVLRGFSPLENHRIVTGNGIDSIDSFDSIDIYLPITKMPK